MIVAVANQKGGTGKTTTAINVAVYSAVFGNRVLLVDVDPQGNATSGLGQEKDPPTLYEVLSDVVPAKNATRQVNIEDKKMFLIPSNNNLTGIEVELVGVPRREYRLAERIRPLVEAFDLVVLDCPPSLSLLTVMALVCADKVLVPVQAEFFALEGLAQLMNTIKLVKERLNPGLDLLGVVLTMVDARTNLSASVVDEVKQFFKDKVFHTSIPRNVRLGEAPSYGLPILSYDPKSAGATAYRSLALEVCGRLGLKTELA